MKKKEYMSPTMIVVVCEDMKLLAGSSVNSSNYNIVYGGIDETGNVDPE